MKTKILILLLCASTAHATLIDETPGGWNYSEHGNQIPPALLTIINQEISHHIEFFDEAQPSGWVSLYGTLPGGTYFFTDLIGQTESTANVSWSFGDSGYGMRWIDVFGFNNGDPWEHIYRVPHAMSLDSSGWIPTTLNGDVIITGISFYGTSPTTTIPDGGSTLGLFFLGLIALASVRRYKHAR